MQNLDKVNPSVPETYLNIGGGFRLLVGSTFKLIAGALGTGGMTNAAKASIGETWGSITTTWGTELRSWKEISALISNSSRSLTSAYTASSIAFSNSTLTGAATSLTLADDVYSDVIMLPFTFRFYERDVNMVYVGSNGILSFDKYNPEQFAFFYIPIEDNTYYRALIYGFGTDLLPSRGGTIKYETLGSAPSRIFVVEYLNIQGYYLHNTVSTQIKLFETSNNIEVHTLSGITDWRGGIQGICDWHNRNTVVLSQDRNAKEFELTNDGVRFSTSPTITNLDKP